MGIRIRRWTRRHGRCLILRESRGFLLQKGIDVAILVGKMVPKLQILTLARKFQQDVSDSLVYLVDICAEETLNLVFRWRVALRVNDPEDREPRRSLSGYALRIHHLIDVHNRLTSGTP